MNDRNNKIEKKGKERSEKKKLTKFYNLYKK